MVTAFRIWPVSLLAVCWLTASALSVEPARETTGPPTRGRSIEVRRFVRSFDTAREASRHKLLNNLVRSPRNEAAAADAIWTVLDAERLQRRVPGSILRAARELGRFDQPELVERMTLLLASPDPRLVLIAVDVLAQRDDALPALIALADGEPFRRNYAVRHAVVRAVGRHRTPAAVDFLVDRLPHFGGQLRYESARQLARLTGENFGSRADGWQQWWSRNREGFEARAPAAAELAAVREIPWDGALPRFFDVPIYASRVVFVIDSSKSMLSSVDGETRLERVQAELRAAIEALPSDAWFEIIAFNDELRPWQGKLVPATPENRRAALAFVAELDARRKTACYDALITGLGVDPQTEALLFLSDGKPTAGRIRQTQEILRLVTETNEFQRVSINTVAVDSRDEELAFMKGLAAGNFGECQLVR